MPKGVQNAGASTALAQSFGLVGKVSLSMDEVIVPVAVIKDLSELTPDDSNFARLASGSNTAVAGGVGTTSRIWLWNPTGSGVLLRLSQIWILGTSAGQELELFSTATDLFTLSNPESGFRDLRVQGDPVAEVRSQNNGLFLFLRTIARYTTFGGTAQEVIRAEYVIPEGRGIGVAAVNQNDPVGRTNFLWTEEGTRG